MRSPFGIADVEDDPLALLQCHVPETLPIDSLGIQDTLVDDAYAIRPGLRRLGRAARRVRGRGLGLPGSALPVGAGEPPDQGHEAVSSFEKGHDGNCDGYPRRAEEDRDADDQRGTGHEEQERELDHRGLDSLFAASVREHNQQVDPIATAWW